MKAERPMGNSNVSKYPETFFDERAWYILNFCSILWLTTDTKWVRNSEVESCNDKAVVTCLMTDFGSDKQRS